MYRITLLRGDLGYEHVERLAGSLFVPIDLETDRLDFNREDWHLTGQIQLVALYDITCDEVLLVSIDEMHPPYRLIGLVGSHPVLVHNARFDLRMIAHYWGVLPPDFLCTKQAAQLLKGTAEGTSLQALLDEYLGVEVSKDLELRTSGFRWPLTEAQIRYAAEDVVHLPDLAIALLSRLTPEQLEALDREKARLMRTLKTYLKVPCT